MKKGDKVKVINGMTHIARNERRFCCGQIPSAMMSDIYVTTANATCRTCLRALAAEKRRAKG